MSTTTSSGALSTHAAPAWPVWFFRISITVAAVLMFFQAIFAGQFMGGLHSAFSWHDVGADVADAAVLVSLVAAFFLRRGARTTWWPVILTAILLVLASAQTTVGHLDLVALHVPLGVLVIALTTVLAVWAWMPIRVRAVPAK